MKITSLAIKNAQFTFTLVILLVLVGIVSYFNMPRSEDPQFDLPITFVDVIYPGASSTDMETLIVDLLEQEASDIEDIKKIESQIRNGSARISFDFLYGTDADDAFNQVKQAVASVKPQFPAGVQNVMVIKATPTSVAISQLAIWSEPNNYKQTEFYAKQLEKRLEAIESVRKASIWGYPQQIVAVEVNLALLKHYGLSVNAINRVLAGRAVNITPGFVDANTRCFNVKASGNFSDIDALANTIVKNDDDYVLRLKDVATIDFASRAPTYLAYYQEKPVIFLTVEQRENTNIFQVTEKINQEIAAFKELLPASVKIETLFQQADSVNVRVNGFFDNLWQGLVLVGLVALIFLGWRESFVVVLAIPLSFLIAIGWLDFAGFGLQQMSIVGLIIALGLLVDNAIVVTESIHREVKTSPDLKEAAKLGCQKVAGAISSGTLTTMLAFLPMLMLASNTGDFVRSMPVTVVFVLLASLLIALSLTPMLASKLFTTRESKFKTLQHLLNRLAKNVYAPLLKALFKVKIIVVVLAVITLVAMASLFPKVGVSLFPKAEKPMLLIDVVTPDNSSFEHTKNVVQQVGKQLKQYSEIDKVALNIGSSNPRIYYNEIPKRGRVKFGQIVLVLKRYEQQEVTALVDKLRDDFSTFPLATVRVKEFTQGPVTDQPITVRLVSESLDDLAKVANELENYMASLDGVINIENPIGEANTELVMAIDYDFAGLSLIDIEQLDNTLKTITSGTTIGRFNDPNGEDYPIVVRRENPDIDGLASIDVENSRGDILPLSQVVTTKLAKGHSDFFHYQKLRMAKVSADVASNASVNQLTQTVVEFLQRKPLPKGMYFTLGGEEESRQESFAGLTQIMLITAIGIFAVLVLQFKSFLQPLVIFTSIPFALTGSVVGLYLTNLSFSMMAFIGLISLFGIVVNNAIILIDTANQNREQGQEKLAAIINASATRFTPILLTTLTTIVGLLPLAILGGGLWQPLAVVIISGLIVSALASFLIVPVLTAIFTKQKLTQQSTVN